VCALQRVLECVLQRVAACCSMLQHVAACCSVSLETILIFETLMTAAHKLVRVHVCIVVRVLQ